MKAFFAVFSVVIFVLCGCGSTSNFTDVSVTSVNLNFGVTMVGTSATQTAAVVTNSGTTPVTINPVVNHDTNFSIVSSGGCGTTLAPGAQCNLLVQYAPAIGSSPVQETVTINLQAKGLAATIPQAVVVSGTPGVPSLGLSASSYNFGQLLVGTSVSKTTAVVSNTGNVTLALGPALSGNASFSLASGGCGAQLLPGAQCNVVVQYAPATSSSVAPQVATVSLGAQPLLSEEMDSIKLTGTPGVPLLSLSAPSYDFGVLSVGTAVSQTTTVVTNTGNLAMTLAPALSGTADFSLVAGGCGTSLAVGAKCNVVVQYAPPTSAGAVQETATIRLGAQPRLPGVVHAVAVTGTPGVPAIGLSASTYSFGDLLVGGSQTQTAAIVTNTGNLALTLSPAISGDAGFTLAAGGCGTQLAVGATCEVVVQYAPTVSSSPAMQAATVNLGVQSLAAGQAETVAVSGMSGAISGAVTTTANAMVAKYTLTLPFAGMWNVSFGTGTGYGLTTNTVTAGAAGSTSVFVAGMLPNTTYHMRATVTLPNGQTGKDVDHTFASGALPAGIPASFPVTLGVGTPSPGIELMDPIIGGIPSSLIATDLKGNVIWSYKPTVTGVPFVYPAKLLSNGDVMMYIAPNSSPIGVAGTDVLREIDLAGDTVRELTMATLNTELTAAGYPTVNGYFTHDFEPLPNGHTLVMVNASKAYTNLTGLSGTTNVVGDVVIDLDANWQPDWMWSEFDHFDVNRHPMQFPDWTHSNSLSYSVDDGDFIVSMRHQNWVAKVDFQDGKGSGNVIWKLGEGGDFKLVGGVDPTDWFYAQHHVTYQTKNTTGVYSLGVMDNGDDRIFPNGKQCGTSGEPTCYTTIQELQIDESAMTATLQFHQILPNALYNVYGGNVEILANGDVEYGLPGISSGTDADEVTPGSNPQTVWELKTPGSQGYRTFRMPSLYSGVQW